MATTPLRTSRDILVDENLSINDHKIVDLTPGTDTGHGVEFDQMITAANDATEIPGSAIHESVANLTAAKAITVTNTTDGNLIIVRGRVDKMIMLIETLGLYRFDAESTQVSDDINIIRPTDVLSDNLAGRWIKLSVSGTRVYRAVPTGAINGINTQFTISALILSGTEEVFLNGKLCNVGSGNDYTISYGATTTITFEIAPLATHFADIILVNYSY